MIETLVREPVWTIRAWTGPPSPILTEKAMRHIPSFSAGAPCAASRPPSRSTCKANTAVPPGVSSGDFHGQALRRIGFRIRKRNHLQHSLTGERRFRIGKQLGAAIASAVVAAAAFSGGCADGGAPG